jgi:hypothetical protein
MEGSGAVSGSGSAQIITYADPDYRGQHIRIMLQIRNTSFFPLVCISDPKDFSSDFFMNFTCLKVLPKAAGMMVNVSMITDGCDNMLSKVMDILSFTIF